MFGNNIHDALIHAATRYDARREGKPNYNRYALAQYFGRIADAEKMIKRGTKPREALFRCFNDRLLDALLKAIDEPKATKEEIAAANARNYSAIMGR